MHQNLFFKDLNKLQILNISKMKINLIDSTDPSPFLKYYQEMDFFQKAVSA